MSFGHWLKGATRIRLDDRTLGNVLKNGAVAGGTIVGGPLGLAIGGVGGVAGQAALGGNLGESLHAGLQGAANTGLAQAGKGVLSHAIHSGAPTMPSTPAGGAPSTGISVPADANLTGAQIPTGSTFGIPGAGHSPGFLRSALNTGKGALEWAGNHDKTTSALLSGVGDALDPNEERLQRAQADALERKNSETDYDFNQKKARDLALEPLRQALYGSLGNGYSKIAPNPYTTGGA